MTDWVNIANSTVAPKAPVTSELVTALRDNTVVSTWEFYETVYDAALDGTVAVVETSDFQDGWEYGFMISGVTGDAGGTVNFFLSFYDETSATYSGNVIYDAQTSSTGPFRERFGFVVLPRVPADRFQLLGLSGSAAAAYLSFNVGSAAVLGKAKFAFATGNIDSGTIKMYRRKENISDA